MSDKEVQDLLRSIDGKLTALISIHTQRLLADDPQLANPRPRPIDVILHDAGLGQQEIANILGKTRQAVGHILRKERD